MIRFSKHKWLQTHASTNYLFIRRNSANTNHILIKQFFVILQQDNFKEIYRNEITEYVFTKIHINMGSKETTIYYHLNGKIKLMKVLFTSICLWFWQSLQIICTGKIVLWLVVITELINLARIVKINHSHSSMIVS